ncbi:MAG: nitroreductase family protein [Candidatus Adiutrix sp.]|jgi:hypothetical protein|nr:nitroreductase family protein [Candidatus Adiutrix sp.]
MKMTLFRVSLLLALILTFGSPPAAGAQDNLKLAQPALTQGQTVLQALKARKSERDFGSAELSRQRLSEVLWAAGGVNRQLPDGRVGRTAPSSHGDQAIEIYALTKDAVYKYDHLGHELVFLLDGDHRAAAGVQSYVAGAPLNLIYAADLSRVSGDTEADKLAAVYMDVGHISENVYLYGASAGLNVICRSSIDRDELKSLLKLPEHYLPLLGQTVGLPK